MSNTIRIKRRASGSPGAPSSLNNAELAYNEVDDVLYYGKGTGGAGGTATVVMAIGGPGSMVTLGGAQTISGVKTFSASPQVPTVSSSDNSTNSASTAYVKSQGYITGNQTITFTGDATGSGSTSVALTLANSGVTAGTYPKVTVDAKGRVTGGASLIASDIPTLTSSYISDFATSVRANRLDQMAAPTASVSFNSQRIMNLADPVSSTDATTKQYVDSLIQGLDPKASVKAASTANLTLSGTQTVDGVALAAGDRVLVKNQTTTSDNGIYVVASGAWTRSVDMDAWTEFPGAYVVVEQGTTNADTGWLCTVDAGGTLGSTAVSWVQFIGAGQVTARYGLTQTGNTIDVNAGTGLIADSASVRLTGQALALHNLATTGLIALTAAGAVSGRTMSTSGTGISITNPDGVSGNPTWSLSTPLSTIGGLTAATDTIAYFSSAAAAATTAFTSYGRGLVGAANNAAFLTAAGLGSMANQSASAVAITGGTVDGLTIDGGTF